MTNTWLIGFLATFIGVGIGGGIAYFINGFSRSIGTIYAVCTGLILGLISFEIAPEAIQMGNWGIFSIGFFLGIVLFKLLHIGIQKKSMSLNKSHTSMYYLAIVFSLHNLPMGVVIGSLELSDAGQSLLKVIILHNIPEGMILFVPLFLAGSGMIKMLFISFLVSSPVAIGALLGEVMHLSNDLLWAFLMSLVVGMIYMVTMKEILPQSIRHSSNRYSVVVAVITFFLMGSYMLYFK
ncbi:ZIP family metal transporter [Sporosarcina siberiensis]|uniref:ZIP family metal transporter n=1 Tax=Sporosarcina siberiensis TaxID=1365606 RepID=A0ABW4SM35_9BACL